MKFTIYDYEDSFGSHRFSNSQILEKLKKDSREDGNLFFVWWTERLFLLPHNQHKAMHLEHKDWFGVMHVPLLTPAWAIDKDGQNDLAKLHFSKSWRRALTRCKGIICLSDHMANQVRALYPDLNVFTAKHPTDLSVKKFQPNLFLRKKQVVLVGAWLRNYQAFMKVDVDLKKIILFNKYAKNYLKKNYSQYAPDFGTSLDFVEKAEFLEDDEYDDLLCSSLVFAGLHETSANNTICECIARNTPFIVNRHPAVMEYCGEDYPLLVDTYDLNISLDRVLNAYEYLVEQSFLKADLALNVFSNRIKQAYEQIVSSGGGQSRLVIYIVTPSFNSASTLWETLNSVFTQNTEGCMVYHHVQDCQSSDDTLILLERWTRKVSAEKKSGYSFSYHSDNDRGMYDAISIGFNSFSMWDNEWMTWINSDDQLETDAIQWVRRANQIGQDIGWLTGYPSVKTEENEKIVYEVMFGSLLAKSGLCDSKSWRTIQQEGTFWKYKHWKRLDIDKIFRNYKYAGDFSLWCSLAAFAELYQVKKTLGWFNRRKDQKSIKYRDAYFEEVSHRKGALGAQCIASKVTARVINFDDQCIEDIDFNVDIR